MVCRASRTCHRDGAGRTIGFVGTWIRRPPVLDRTKFVVACHYFGVDANDVAGTIRCRQKHGQDVAAAGILGHDHWATTYARTAHKTPTASTTTIRQPDFGGCSSSDVAARAVHVSVPAATWVSSSSSARSRFLPINKCAYTGAVGEPCPPLRATSGGGVVGDRRLVLPLFAPSNLVGDSERPVSQQPT